MPKVTVAAIKKQLQALADPKSAAGMQRFFKTGPGQYAEGDLFLGITIPVQRSVAKQAAGLPITEVLNLLQSPIHEHRIVALMIWVAQFQKGDDPTRQQIYDAYLAHTQWINNWDLVDVSCYHIVGKWLLNRSRRPLLKLAKSKSIWERRIAIVSTYAFIRDGDFSTTLDLAERLMADQHDLIHKAVGWMLREVYKRDASAALAFLERDRLILPRTTLRYAIERCDANTKARLMLRA